MFSSCTILCILRLIFDTMIRAFQHIKYFSLTLTHKFSLKARRPANSRSNTTNYSNISLRNCISHNYSTENQLTEFGAESRDAENLSNASRQRWRERVCMRRLAWTKRWHGRACFAWQPLRACTQHAALTSYLSCIW